MKRRRGKEGRKKMYTLTYDGAKEYKILRENFKRMFTHIMKPTKGSNKKLNLLVKGEK